MKPVKVELQQNTPEWLSWRRCHLCASDTAKIMGLSKYGTAKDVYDDKMGAAPKPINAAMQAGIDNEPVARKIMSKEYGVEFEPAVFESGKYPFMGASLDAITSDWKKGGEIKCVGGKTFDRAISDDIDDDYIIQCQKQMYVADLEEWILFYALVTNNVILHEEDMFSIVIKRDDKFIAKMLKAEIEFWFNHILPGVPPPMTFKDLEQNGKEKDNKIALQWAAAKELETKWKTCRERLETQLKELSEGKSVHYKQARVKLLQVSRRGSIDWDKVKLKWKITPEEIEKYRKKSSTYVTIRSEV